MEVILGLKGWNSGKGLLPTGSREDGTALGSQRGKSCESDYLDLWHGFFMSVNCVLDPRKALLECPMKRAVMNLGKPH